MKPCIADAGDLAGQEVSVWGSVKMVETAVPAFMDHGIADGACHTDAFLPSTALQAQ